MKCPICGSSEYGYDLRSHSSVCNNCGYMKEKDGSPPNVWLLPTFSSKESLMFLAGELVIISTFLFYFSDLFLFLLFTVIWYMILRGMKK